MEYQVSDLKSKPSKKKLNEVINEADQIILIDSPMDMEHYFEGRPNWKIRVARAGVECGGYHGYTEVEPNEGAELKILFILKSVMDWLK